MNCDLKYFFLAFPMDAPVYMKVLLRILPDDIFNQYNLDTLLYYDGCIYTQIQNGVYGLKQAMPLAYKKLSNYITQK